MTSGDDTAPALPAPDPAPSETVWRYARAARAHVVIDAADYFDLLQQAMLGARQRIMLIGWDFDTRIQLTGGRRWWKVPHRAQYPARFGGFIVWLVRRRLSLGVHVLRWNFGALKALLRGSMLLDIIRWSWNRRVTFRLDSAHPLGCSHHQKIVAIDDCFAACGGIDLTSSRRDTPEHLDDAPTRRSPNGKTYQPWHDLSMVVDGEAAAALGELARERWERAGAGMLAPCAPQAESPWPAEARTDFRDVEIGIARTRAAYNGAPEIREIEALFVAHIARAQKFIYAESQYFASRRIAEAMAQRLAAPDPPEIILITAATAEGWLQREAMDSARVRLMQALAAVDPARRFRAYVPLTAGGQPIYVHSKLMIVDDEILRVGSANLNNRSMGLDSECDVFLDSRRPANAHITGAITRLRHRLLAEHCGIPRGDVARHTGSMASLIENCRPRGKRLVPLDLGALSDTEKVLADNSLLDPERAEELFEPIARRRGLFRKGGLLRRPGEGM